jgi:hypothetical protein
LSSSRSSIVVTVFDVGTVTAALDDGAVADVLDEGTVTDVLDDGTETSGTVTDVVDEGTVGSVAVTGGLVDAAVALTGVDAAVGSGGSVSSWPLPVAIVRPAPARAALPAKAASGAAYRWYQRTDLSSVVSSYAGDTTDLRARLGQPLPDPELSLPDPELPLPEPGPELSSPPEPGPELSPEPGPELSPDPGPELPPRPPSLVVVTAVVDVPGAVVVDIRDDIDVDVGVVDDDEIEGEGAIEGLVVLGAGATVVAGTGVVSDGTVAGVRITSGSFVTAPTLTAVTATAAAASTPVATPLRIRRRRARCCTPARTASRSPVPVRAARSRRADRTTGSSNSSIRTPLR